MFVIPAAVVAIFLLLLLIICSVCCQEYHQGDPIVPQDLVDLKVNFLNVSKHLLPQRIIIDMKDGIQGESCKVMVTDGRGTGTPTKS